MRERKEDLALREKGRKERGRSEVRKDGREREEVKVTLLTAVTLR